MKNQRTAKKEKEAPALPVQSAKQVASKIGGCAEYRAKTAALIGRVCAAFGGRVVGVAL